MYHWAARAVGEERLVRHDPTSTAHKDREQGGNDSLIITVKSALFFYLGAQKASKFR
ncbi:hypothetical protein AA14337_2228 [Acetobacter malorum DSM 14337]|uniref:Transposase n=1 Tax=Acetobacter malorum DSM 14337 TaxID=1307910 RepID=A0ABQ0PUW3_9PROT|nr:hypothetical protein AA14337_2228 [Acetobacter malorum DSM 14337]